MSNMQSNRVNVEKADVLIRAGTSPIFNQLHLARELLGVCGTLSILA